MIDADVTAAFRAIPTVADVAAIESPEELRSFGKDYVLFFHNVNALTGAAE
jgi:hypothetical protein